MTKTKKKLRVYWFLPFLLLAAPLKSLSSFPGAASRRDPEQLREIKDLKDADVLDSTQFEAQKKILLTELNELH